MIKPLKEVLEYQNQWVIDRFKKTNSWFSGTDADIEILFNDLKRFLWLYAIQEQKKIENPEEEIADVGFSQSMLIIDEIWHSFILYTKFYEEFCNEYFGGFLHHPTPAPKYVKNIEKIGQTKAAEILVKEMLELVYDKFGEGVTVRWFDEYFKYNSFLNS